MDGFAGTDRISTCSWTGLIQHIGAINITDQLLVAFFLLSFGKTYMAGESNIWAQAGPQGKLLLKAGMPTIFWAGWEAALAADLITA